METFCAALHARLCLLVLRKRLEAHRLQCLTVSFGAGSSTLLMVCRTKERLHQRSPLPLPLMWTTFEKLYDQPDYLKHIPSPALLVYKNKASFDKRNTDDGKEEPLGDDSFVTDLGNSKDEALIVVVPSSFSISSSGNSSESMLTRKEPHPKRKQRWIELNNLLERNTQKSKPITWNQLKHILNATEYAQPRRNISLISSQSISQMPQIASNLSLVAGTLNVCILLLLFCSDLCFQSL
jgi:hypothetical protein